MGRQPLNVPDSGRLLLVTVGLFTLLGVTTIAPAARASTRPVGATLSYDPQRDRSTVAARLGPVIFAYGFSGKVQVGACDRITVSLDEPYRTQHATVSLLLDGRDRVALDLKSGEAFTPEWVRDLLGRANTLEVIVRTAGGAKRFSAGDGGRQALADLLDRTRYFAPEVVAGRRFLAALGSDAASLIWQFRLAYRHLHTTFYATSDPRGVIYLIDASGSMIDKFGAVKAIVARCASDLSPGARFNVAAVRNGTVLWFRENPVPAGANVHALEAWLSGLGAEGVCDPAPRAIGMAVRQRVGTVIFVSDCDLPVEILNTIDRALQKCQMRLNVLAVATSADDLPADQPLIDAFRRVAEMHGGTLKVRIIGSSLR